MQLRTAFQILGLIAALCLLLAVPQYTFGKTMTLTGCLQKGTEANEYQLVADGKTYGLMGSATVNLAEHVGHEVTITGTTTKEPKESAAREKEEKMAGTEEASHLNVTSLKHVSDTCTSTK